MASEIKTKKNNLDGMPLKVSICHLIVRAYRPLRGLKALDALADLQGPERLLKVFKALKSSKLLKVSI